MSRLKRASDALKFDIRLRKYNMSNDILSQEERAKYLEQLPDLADKTESLKLEMESAGSSAAETSSSASSSAGYSNGEYHHQ